MMKRWILKCRDYAAIRERRSEFRALLEDHCGSAGFQTHELVFGELVTNAVRHGDDPIEVAVAVRNGNLQIEVENAGNCFDLEHRLSAAPTATGGRGLQIVRALVDTLTVGHSPGEICRVTATLRL